jgi:hypothetical protein
MAQQRTIEDDIMEDIMLRLDEGRDIGFAQGNAGRDAAAEDEGRVRHHAGLRADAGGGDGGGDEGLSRDEFDEDDDEDEDSSVHDTPSASLVGGGGGVGAQGQDVGDANSGLAQMFQRIFATHETAAVNPGHAPTAAEEEARRQAALQRERGLPMPPGGPPGSGASDLRVVPVVGGGGGGGGGGSSGPIVMRQRIPPAGPMSLEDAYFYLNPAPPPPSQLTKKRGQQVSGAKRKRGPGDGETSEEEATAERTERGEELQRLFAELHMDLTPELRQQYEAAMAREQARGGSPTTPSKRRRVHTTMTGSDVPDLDNDYLEKMFGELVQDANMGMEQFLDFFCPLCGFGNLLNFDRVSATAYRDVMNMAEVGIMFVRRETLAVILCESWNTNVYRPMRARNKRILPLTYEMAFNHIDKPHRPDPRPDHRRDIEELNMLKGTLGKMMFQYNPVLGKMQIDQNIFKMVMACYRQKNILRKQVPEKMAFYAPQLDHNTQAAGGMANPFRALELGFFDERASEQRHKRTVPGSLGGRQTATAGGSSSGTGAAAGR